MDDDLFQAVADQLPTPMWVHGPDGSQVFVNLECCRFHGLTCEDLRDALALATSVTALSPHLAYVIDVRERRARALNDHTASLLGLGRDSDDPCELDELVRLTHPDDAARVRDHLQEVMSTTTGTDLFEYRLPGPAGTWRWFECRHLPLSVDETTGEVTEVLGSGTEITAHKESLELERTARRRVQFLGELSSALAATVDVEGIAELVVERIAAAAGGDAALYLCDGDALEAAADTRPGRRGHRLALSDPGPVAQACRTGTSVAIDSNEIDPAAATTILAAPVPDGGRAVLVWERPGPAQDGQGASRLLEACAGQVAGALERARLHDEAVLARQEATRARRRAEAIAEILGQLEQPRGLRRRAQLLASLLVPRMADFAIIEAPGTARPVLGIAHRDPAKQLALRRLREDHRLPDEAPQSARSLARGPARLVELIEPAVLDTYGTQAEAHELLSHLAPLSHLLVPVDLGGAEPGVLMLGLDDPSRRAFDRDDFALAQGLAERAGVILATARLHDEEREISLRLQRAQLPDRLVEVSGLHVSAHYRAAHERLEVGGDWYDTYRWGQDRLGVVVGDVVGHGIEAAAAMGRIRAATAALAARTDGDPAAVIEALDEVTSGPDGVDFSTAACVTVDSSTASVAFACAGHPPPLLIEPDGSSHWLDSAHSTPMCRLPAERGPSGRAQFPPGSVLVMYTDGLVERRGQELGECLEIFRRIAVEAAGLTTAHLGARLADIFLDDDHRDDTVVVTVENRPWVTRFCTSIPPSADALSGLRHDAAQWCKALPVTEAAVADVLVALTEAVDNAVEHAAADGANIDVTIEHDREDLVVVVSNRGGWDPSPPAPGRGRGITLMSSLARSLQFERPAGGTTVVIRIGPC